MQSLSHRSSKLFTKVSLQNHDSEEANASNTYMLIRKVNCGQLTVQGALSTNYTTLTGFVQSNLFLALFDWFKFANVSQLIVSNMLQIS